MIWIVLRAILLTILVGLAVIGIAAIIFVVATIKEEKDRKESIKNLK